MFPTPGFWSMPLAMHHLGLWLLSALWLQGECWGVDGGLWPGLRELLPHQRLVTWPVPRLCSALVLGSLSREAPGGEQTELQKGTDGKWCLGCSLGS